MKLQQGLSLIELMIALLLGSVVTIAATQLFLVNRQTENLQLGISSVQDGGRFAFDFVSRDLMQSGFAPDEPVAPFEFDSGVADGADGVKFDTLVSVVDGGLNCVGSGTFSGLKKLHVVDDSAGKRLVCTVYSWQDQTDGDGNVIPALSADDRGPLIDNVEAFQVLYGIDFDAPDHQDYGYPNTYVNATVASGLNIDNPNNDYRIVSVRYAILVASDARVSLDTSLALDSIDVLDKTFDQGTEDNQIDFEDGRLYRIYTSTVALRNVVAK